MSEHHHSAPSLEDRLRSIELELSAARRPRRRPASPPRGLRRGLTIVATIVAVVILPVAVFASDTFTDVPASHSFHDTINDVFNAGITNGCNATQFCPGTAVNRGQMSAFLSRGLPRAAADQDQISVVADTANADVATITIDTPGVDGGTGFVVVTGSVSAYASDATTCPCEVGMRVVDTGTLTEPGLWQFFDVSNTVTGSGFRNGSGSQSWVFEVATNSSSTFAVRANIDVSGGDPFLTLQANVSAVYVPFSAAGTVVLEAPDATTDGR